MAYSPWSHEELGETERLEREKEREREMPLLGPGACGQPRASSWTAVSEASSILSSCFCVGGSAGKNPLVMQEIQVLSLGWEDPLEEDMTTYSGILAWKII